MLYALVVAAVLGQTGGQTQPEQAVWLLSNLRVDMQLKGTYTPDGFRQVEQQVARLTSAEVDALVRYYQQLKTNVADQQQTYGQAVGQLQQAIAYRDRLGAEVATRQQPVFIRASVGMLPRGPMLGPPVFGGGLGYPVPGYAGYGMNGPMLGAPMGYGVGLNPWANPGPVPYAPPLVPQGPFMGFMP